jgi:trans-2,3-dihydro-3-hydroxyanthranilate isomerase
MKPYRYTVVDVFTREPLAGNPLAVFPDASDLEEAMMQKIARELNLAETTFVLPATRKDCVARVRIFTTAKELPFAGHPTVGTAFVLWQAETAPGHGAEFALEEEMGPIPLRIEGGDRPLIWLRMPPLREGRRYDSARCAGVLGLNPQDLLPMKPQLLSAGNPTLVIGVVGKTAVDRACLDLAGLKTLMDEENQSFCVYLFTPTPEGAYSRMFAPEYGIPEDAASGSCMGPLAAFMMRHNLTSNIAGKRFVCEQGTKMGRRSLLHVEIRGTEAAEGIYVGGYVTPIVEALMTLDLHEDSSRK